MATLHESSQKIFNTVEELLVSTEFGYEDLTKSSTPRKLHGLKTLVVFGRAITNVLQNLRDSESTFDAWYEKYKEEMANDPLMRYFYKLRTVVLKKATHEIGILFEVKQLDFPGDFLGAGSVPPNAKGLFVAGNGVGWVIKNNDGSTERRYVQMPPDKVSMTLLLTEPPRSHLGQEIEDTSAENLCRLFLDYLKHMAESAKKQFGAY